MTSLGALLSAARNVIGAAIDLGSPDHPGSDAAHHCRDVPGHSGPASPPLPSLLSPSAPAPQTAIRTGTLVARTAASRINPENVLRVVIAHSGFGPQSQQPANRLQQPPLTRRRTLATD